MLAILEKAATITLTPTEEAILTYLYQEARQVAYMNLEELSTVLFTSNATIVRFCQKLGFTGYHEFKYALRKELSEVQQIPVSSMSLIDASLASYQDQLELMDISSLATICNLITSDRPLYLYGSELSALAAKYLQVMLTTLDRACILIEWRNLLEGICSNLDEHAILFLISAHGDADRYHSVYEKALKKKATIILLTCNENSPLIQQSTIAINTFDELKELHQVDINSRLGMLSMIQLIIEYTAQKILTSNQ